MNKKLCLKITIITGLTLYMDILRSSNIMEKSNISVRKKQKVYQYNRHKILSQKHVTVSSTFAAAIIMFCSQENLKKKDDYREDVATVILF